MPVTFDAVSATTGTVTGGSGGGAMSWSHTATGADLVALVAVTVWKTDGSTPASSGARSCTYGGVAMTSLGTRQYADNTGYIEVFTISIS